MQQYLDLLYKTTQAPCIPSRNGTVHSVYGEVLRFNMQDGFPLVTTRCMPFKTGIYELLWFIKGATSLDNLDESVHAWWQPFADEHGQLGPIYGAQLRRMPILGSSSIIEVQPRRTTTPLPFGKKHHEFVHGKGSIHGEYADNTLSSSLYQIWYDILGRCYNTKFKDYKKYGGKGVHVSNEWLDFGRFKHEVMLLPRWEEAYKNLHRHLLSRAYYNSDVYSFNTCVWLTCPEHRIYCENASPFTMYSVPESRYIGTFLSIKECAYEYDLYESRIYDVLQGYTTEYAGYSFAYLPFTKDILYRHPLAIDQLQTVIDMLKSDPFSRRIGYSLWNSEKIPLMQLPPCHGVHVAFHVTCVDGVSALSLSMVQRSADVFLGLPTNISSYALLLHMVAQCVGMIPGELTIFIHNSHLYSAHFRVAQRQLERYPLKLPYLILDKTIDNINMFTVDSFSLQKYEHHLPLQGKLIV